MEKVGKNFERPPVDRPGKPKASESGPADPNRRVFIKNGLLIGSGAALSVGVGAGLMNFFGQNHKSVDNKNSNPDGQHPLSPATKREKPSLPEKKFLDTILNIYYDLSKREEFFPKKIFSSDFLIAQQIQESNYQPAAVSSAAAYGVMQTRDIAVLDAHRYLKKLNRQGIIDYPLNNFDEKLNGLDLKIIQEFIKNNSDYSRALGKIYLMCLHGQDGYAIGRSKIKSGQAQKEILMAYNGGPAILRRKNSAAYKIAQDYASAIINIKDTIGLIRRKAKEKSITFDNYQVAKLAISSRGKKQVENYIDDFLAYYKNK